MLFNPSTIAQPTTKIIGVGQGGGNAIDTMIEGGLVQINHEAGDIDLP